ncbi:hypothetical protein AQ490_25765 [Wenjunlia vitaminophila]|uniref:Acyl-CoA synthetase n=1 Tax=Wenjunlia vitaminophila TaxID=76728 RepID=A0A0T6LQ78_WENVI|nr:AMP-binding protein [Wenjunlia vitaminophila]KRV48214.1 hypothetical protein AQ490_25765 [Wenjunlia vitaminophila]
MPKGIAARPVVRHPADLARIEEQPLKRWGLPGTTYELLLAAAASYGDAPAHTYLATGGRKPVEVLSFRALADRVTRVARTISAVAGDVARPVTSLLLSQGPWVMAGQWGAQAAGVANPVNPALASDHLRSLLRTAGTHVLVVPSHQADPARHAHLADIAGDLPELRAVLTVDTLPGAGPRAQEPGPAPRWPVPVLPLERVAPEQTAAPVVPPHQDQVCALFHTGGTTGRPKLAAHRHRNEVYTAWALTLGLELTPGEVMLCGLPPFHVNAVHATGLGPLFSGLHVVFLGPEGFRDTGAMLGFWELVQNHRIATFSAVPTVLSALTRIPVPEGADLSSLRCVYSGAAPLPDAVRRGFEEHCGTPVFQGYGLTEGTCVTALTPACADAPPPGTVGLRLPYQQIRVLGGDGAVAAAGEPGRVQIKGPNVFAGYWGGGPRDTVDAEGWLDTGDLGTLKDGWLFLTGRAKDLIIRGGHNIDPAPVEDALLAHPRVVAAAVVGRPDRHSGEVPVAYVQLAEGADTTREELLAWAREHTVERAAVPKDVRVLPALPVTPVGKVNKVPLREDAAVRAARQLLADRFPGVAVELGATTENTGQVVLTLTPDTGAGRTQEALLDALAGLPVTTRTTGPVGRPDPA